jgi:integrase
MGVGQDHDRAVSELVEAHVSHLKATGRSPRTIRERCKLLYGLHNYLPHGLLFAATDDLVNYLATPGWSRWTRCTYYGHIHGFYVWATKVGYLDGDPTATIDRPPAPRCVPRPISDAHLAIALTAPDPIFTGTLLGAYAGLRVSEAAGVWREHVDEQVIWLAACKGGDSAYVPTHPAIWDHVRTMAAGPLILNHRGTQATGTWLGLTTSRVWARMGVDATFHQLRHWCGTEAQRATRDIRVTQELLRHRSVASTQIYTQVDPDHIRAAVRALPVLTGPARV